MLVAVGVAVVAAAGTAGGAATLDPGPVRSQVANLVTQTYPGLPAGNVACPVRVARTAGVGFACTVQLPGTFLVIDAQQVDGKGRLALSAQQAVIPREKLEQFVAGRATIAATVACGPSAYVVLRPGQRVTCSAAIADGSSRRVELLVLDVDGNVTIASVT